MELGRFPSAVERGGSCFICCARRCAPRVASAVAWPVPMARSDGPLRWPASVARSDGPLRWPARPWPGRRQAPHTGRPCLPAALEPGSLTFQVKMNDSQILRIPRRALPVGAIGASACAMAFPEFGDLTPKAHLHLLSKQGCGRATGYAGGYDRAWIQ